MNVRSAITAMLALTLVLPGTVVTAQAGASVAETEPHVTIAMVPHGTDVEALAEAVPGIAPGLLGVGLGEASSAQSYLDIGQGGRLAQSLYPEMLPPVYVTGDRVPEPIWRQVRGRAAKAPAEIVPGLLTATLEEAGVGVASRPMSGSAAIIAADRSGRIDRALDCEPPECPGLTVATVGLEQLPELAQGLDPERDDLLIAIEEPPTDRELLTIGIAGAGFEAGNLTSPTTRIEGYVLSTDLLPTILARYGVDIPEDVTGREIGTSGGEADPAAVVDLGERLSEVRPRRSGVIGVNLLIWVGLAAAAAALAGRRGAAAGLTILAVSMALMPALLLLSAAIAPSALVERLIIGVGAPLIAAVSLLTLRRPLGPLAAYAAFALAAAVSVGATAVDIGFGSPLTAVSLLGPNPELGVRFFGIGNELEATIGALLTLGAGAAVTARGPADEARAMAITTVVVTVVAVLVFAPGRLGADVGAAITFPAGAAVALIVALEVGRRKALLVLALPVAALAVLFAIDLISGGDAHLSRSVLGAGGLDDLGDVLDRRLTQSARSFPNYIDSPFFIAALLAIVAGIVFRRRIIGWFSGHPAALAGAAGAAGATVVGTLANDSAALLLMVGTGFIAAFCGLVWATSTLAGGRPHR